jgi:hypothetical protein
MNIPNICIICHFDRCLIFMYTSDPTVDLYPNEFEYGGKSIPTPIYIGDTIDRIIFFIMDMDIKY